MLHTVIRPAMSSARTASPANSMTCPVPPAVPMRLITASTKSLAVVPNGSAPFTSTSMLRDFFCNKVCVASTCSTSEVPMPKASAPIAPCVDVWLSPHTMVMPGREMPCSGPMMWTMPCRTSSTGKYGTPNSATLRSRVSTWMRLSSSLIPDRRSVVAMLWSATAMVASGRRTRRPARRRPSKACGLVTSWTRCRSM